MKRFFALIMIVALAAPTMQSCSRKTGGGILGGTGATVGKTVATVVGVILLSKILKSVLGNVMGNQAFSSFNSNQSLVNNFNEDTKLNTIADNDIMKTALAMLVSSKYEIPLTTVTNNFSNLKTAEDLATFIGKNASPDALKKIQAMPD